MGMIYFVVKYSLFILNLVFTILGIAIVAVGTIINIQFEKIALTYSGELDVDEDVMAEIKLLSILIIVFGCIIFLIAFSGCCGAVTETKCLLVTYAVFMFFLITSKIYLTVMWNRDLNSIRNSTNKFLNKTFDDPTNNVTFHIMEASLHCCGTTGPDSYEEVLPPTCCVVEETIDFESECLLEDAFSIGCLELIDSFIADLGKTIKTVLICVIVIETLEFIASVYLFASIDKGRPKPTTTLPVF